MLVVMVLMRTLTQNSAAVAPLFAVKDTDIDFRRGKTVIGVERATLFTLCRNEDLGGMLASIKSLQVRFNDKHNYPWVFANDVPFSEVFKESIARAVSGDVTFTTIPKQYWSVPDWIDQDKMEKSMLKLLADKIPYSMSQSYRQMCRFYSGFFYKLKALDQYDWYWRVEPDITYTCNLPEDPFGTMQKGNKVYGFSIAMTEFENAVEDLWETSRNHFENQPWWSEEQMTENGTIPGTSLGFIEMDADTRQIERGSYNLCHYWSNYEVGNLVFYRSDKYEKYFQALDKTGDFFYKRWGDAPVHSMAVSYLLPPEKIQYFDNTGYYHGEIGNCPRDRAIFKALDCSCNRRREFSWRSWSCVPRWFDGLGLERPNNTH